MHRLLVLVTVSVWCGLSHAEGAKALRWTLDEFRTSCIPVWSEEPAAACKVAEFGEVAKLGGSTLYFALYDDPSQPNPGWASQSSRQRNVLVLLRATAPNPQEATVMHVRKPEPSYVDGMFHPPELIQTDLGPVLYLRGSGHGDGRFQFQYDEHWLWRSGTLVPLDVHSWFYSMRTRMPAGFELKGISTSRLKLCPRCPARSLRCPRSEGSRPIALTSSNPKKQSA